MLNTTPASTTPTPLQHHTSKDTPPTPPHNTISHHTTPQHHTITPAVLQVVRLWPDPLQVEDHHVPALISERVYSRGDHWDLTTQQILPYIDGFSHVAKIAAAADVDNNLVKV